MSLLHLDLAGGAFASYVLGARQPALSQPFATPARDKSAGLRLAFRGGEPLIFRAGRYWVPAALAETRQGESA